MSEEIKEEVNNLEETIKEPITKKDPKKVEQGKRLAAISKQAKEEKMRRKIQEENFSYFPYIMYTLAALSSLGFAYSYFFKKEPEILQPVTVAKSPEKKPASSEKKPLKFENLG